MGFSYAADIDKIVLGRRYSIEDWLPGAYEAVCMREDPLTLEEAMRLSSDVTEIGAGRRYGRT